MKIAVIGAGYVGLTTGACLAQLGHEVLCAESDRQKLDGLQKGTMPFFEPYLEQVVSHNRRANRLTFGRTEEAIEHGQTIFICVGTPPLENGEADLTAIESVARTIARRGRGYKVIVEKSTVPVQTGQQIRKHLAWQKTIDLEYDVVSNPEFLREGSAVADFFHPDRIVVGGGEERAIALVKQIYTPVLTRNFDCPLHEDCSHAVEPRFLVTDTNSAELIKHASNSFLATKISFINMIADLCEAAGADITKVAEGIGLDPRIGVSFLRPGIGFGGFCFPKDLQAFVHIAEKFGCDFGLLKEVERVNHGRIERFVKKVRQELWVLREKKIAVWGLAFKPDTDDIRFAPALAVIRKLLLEGAKIQAYDPQAMEKCRKELPDITYCEDLYQASKGVEAILHLTEWNEFHNADWGRLSNLVERRLVLDGRNTLSREVIAMNGFQYLGVGGVSAPAAEVDSLVLA